MAGKGRCEGEDVRGVDVEKRRKDLREFEARKAGCHSVPRSI